MALDLDQVFQQIGSMGFYQVTLIFFMGFVYFTLCLHVLAVSFTALEPPWRCVSSSLLCNITSLIRPSNKFYQYRCDIPRSDWEFHDDYTSIVTEWDLVCNKTILGSVATSLVFPGWILGMLVFGFFSDRYGRKSTLFMCTSLLSIVGFISSFSPTYWFYALCRFIIGIGVGGAVNTAFIMGFEFTGVRQRALISVLMFNGWTLGASVLPAIVYSLPKWQHSTIAVSLSGLPIVFMWWYMSESPRWLLVEGKHNEMKEVIYQIARSNGRVMPKEDIVLTYQKPENSKNGNTLDLFRNRYIAKKIVFLFFIWFSLSVMFYATTFAAVNIGGNMYLTFFIVNVVLLPQPILSSWMMNKFGRKQATSCGLLVGAVGGFCIITITDDDQSSAATAGRVGLFIIVRLFIGVSFAAAYLYTSEVLPTMTRNIGLAWCSTMARFGAFSAPYILWLKRISPVVPMSIMATFALVAAILSFFLKDTLMAPTKETVAEIDAEVENNVQVDITEEHPGRTNEGFDLTHL